MVLGSDSGRKLLILLSFAAIYLIWGSTYLVNFLAIAEIPPFLLSALRFLLAGSILFLTGFLRGEALPNFKQTITAIWMGFLFMVIGTAMVVWAEQHIDTGLAALTAGFEPVAVVICVWIVDRRRPNAKTVGGLLLGVTGIYVLVGQPTFPRHPQAFQGLLAIASAIIAWAWGSVAARKANLPTSRSFAAAIQMLGGGGILLMISTANGEWYAFHPTSLSGETWLAFAYLTLFGSLIAFSAFQYLLQQVPPEMVATSNYVNPVVAVLLGWQLNGESLSRHTLLAGTLLLTGVFLVNLPEKKPGLAPP